MKLEIVQPLESVREDKLGPDEVTRIWLEKENIGYVRVHFSNRLKTDWLIVVHSDGEIETYPKDAEAMGFRFREERG